MEGACLCVLHWAFSLFVRIGEGGHEAGRLTCLSNGRCTSSVSQHRLRMLSSPVMYGRLRIACFLSCRCVNKIRLLWVYNVCGMPLVRCT